MSKQRHLVTANRLAPDGQGVASSAAKEDHTSGSSAMEFLVQDLLPGESAWVEIEHQSPHKERAWARIAERCSGLSPSRTAPKCPAFGVCGGCAWQHLAHAAQLAQKCARVQTALDAQLAYSPTLTPPMPSRDTAYRNKGKYVFTRAGEMIGLGAYKPRSHDVVSTLDCQVVEAPIAAVAKSIAAHANALQPPVYDEKLKASEGLRYAVVRSNAAGEALVLLICTSGTPEQEIRSLAACIFEEPQVVGVSRCNNDEKSGVLLTQRVTPLVGAPTLSEYASGVKIELGPAAFWQVNRAEAARAFAELGNALPLPQGAHILELYCGVGALSFALANAGYTVLGVESNSEAVETARKAAANAGLESQLQFHHADARQLPASMLANADAIVVDPPRKGLGKAGTLQLTLAKPRAIAYLSCGPESLARDLAALVEAGYALTSMRLYDFMPGTSQIEALAILQLEDSTSTEGSDRDTP